MNEIQLANIDDLRDLKYTLSEMERGHVKGPGHDYKGCARCNEIAELRVGLAVYHRNRTRWLEKCRDQDRKELKRLEQQIYNTKKRRRIGNGTR